MSTGKWSGRRPSILDYKLQNFQILNGNIVRVTIPAYSCNEKEGKGLVFWSGLLGFFNVE